MARRAESDSPVRALKRRAARPTSPMPLRTRARGVATSGMRRAWRPAATWTVPASGVAAASPSGDVEAMMGDLELFHGQGVLGGREPRALPVDGEGALEVPGPQRRARRAHQRHRE